jgi:pimeloyl-ACP methyl ester carboxylesterase
VSASNFSLRKPSPRSRALLLMGAPLALGVGLAGSPFAQSAPLHQHPRPAPGLLQLPPAPAVMRDSIQVSGDRLQQYATRYERHMAATKPARDSLQASMEAMRAAFQRRDRPETRAQREIIQRQSQQLAARNREFDDGLRQILTQDQQNRYQQWKENRQKEVRDRWQHGRRSRGGARGWAHRPGAADSVGNLSRPSSLSLVTTSK